MQRISARNCQYSLIRRNTLLSMPLYSLLKDINGNIGMCLVSPQHGRSYVVGRTDDGRYVVSKGNGLSYTSSVYIETKESKYDIWGLMQCSDAIRDYDIGNEVSELGILTNRMHAVLQLQLDFNADWSNDCALLQYDVITPYRISDAAFMESAQILELVKAWAERFDGLNLQKHKSHYLQAAEVLFHNLRVLHENGILHNAITSQNYTWALELLDFELACSPSFPYDSEDYVRHHVELFEREIIHTYQIVCDIAWILRENIDHELIERIMQNSGFHF